MAIETSCDETSVAFVEKKDQEIKILSNAISSQVKIHAKWGGVVPNLAAREHLKNIVPVLDEALKESKKTIEDVDLIAATQGPGLIPALLLGTNMAKTLSWFHKKPLVGIHHVEGHMIAAFSRSSSKFKVQSSKFPALALVVSGGHTQLVFMEKMFDYKIIGQTQDDAVGEAFDKVAKMLELGYPGGPVVSQRAGQHLKDVNNITDKKFKKELGEIKFTRPLLTSNNLDFSFSGLKTAVLYFHRDLQENSNFEKNQEIYKNAICHKFQEAAVDVLVKKTIKAAKKYAPKTVLLAGGVAANKHLQEELESALRNELDSVQYLAPQLSLCGDNAAMIGAAALLRYEKTKDSQQKKYSENWKDLEADANIKLSSL